MNSASGSFFFLLCRLNKHSVATRARHGACRESGSGLRRESWNNMKKCETNCEREPVDCPRLTCPVHGYRAASTVQPRTKLIFSRLSMQMRGLPLVSVGAYICQRKNSTLEFPSLPRGDWNWVKKRAPCSRKNFTRKNISCKGSETFFFSLWLVTSSI